MIDLKRINALRADLLRCFQTHEAQPGEAVVAALTAAAQVAKDPRSYEDGHPPGRKAFLLMAAQIYDDAPVVPREEN